MSPYSQQRKFASLSIPHETNQILAHRDADCGRRPQHHIVTLGLPKKVEHWSLTTQPEMLIKIGAKVFSHGRYVTFRKTEFVVPRNLFRETCGGSMNCDEDSLRRRPRESTARRKRQEGCV